MDTAHINLGAALPDQGAGTEDQGPGIETLRAATEALQATERLYNELIHHQSKQHQVLSKCGEALDELRHMKSALEGSHVDIGPSSIAESPLQELRQLTLMHVPDSITDDVRTRFKDLILQLFNGVCRSTYNCIALSMDTAHINLGAALPDQGAGTEDQGPGIETLRAATEALQATERLYNELIHHQSKQHQVLSKCGEALDELRHMKSALEGSHVDIGPSSIAESPLQELRQLTLMHVPDSITDDVRTRFKDLILQLFNVLSKCGEALDELRHMKSALEGSHVDIGPPSIAESPLQELRQLTLMHVPDSITDDVRTRFKDLILQLFNGAGTEDQGPGNEALRAAMEALQATERLYNELKHHQSKQHQVLSKCGEALDELRHMKSALEGSHVDIGPPSIAESPLQELRQLTPMHVPDSITHDVRTRFKDLILQLFNGAGTEDQGPGIEALKAATEALQATERLYNELKLHQSKQHQVLSKCGEMLDELRHMKSVLEGSHVDIGPPSIAESPLQELRQLTLMHVPDSITYDVRTRFKDLILQLFNGGDVTILYAALITCPWYAYTQRERGEQAKHNSIFIVYQSPLRRFLSPHSGHLVDKTNVIDKDWYGAAELYHFVQFIVKGMTRSVEALYCPPGAVLYESHDWRPLRTRLHHSKVMGLRNFLEACRGQSVGGIGKKGKGGRFRFRMKDSTTFRELCDSFRLMHHAHNTVNHLPPCTDDPLGGDSCPNEVTRAITLLRSMYQNPDVSKKEAFTILCSWGEQVNKERANFTFTPPEEVHGIVGDWHMQMRLQGQTIRPLTCPDDDHSRLVSLMEDIGGPVAQLTPAQVVLITRAGSYMYNLTTPNSDVDFLIVYTDTTQKVLSACKRLPESVESRGPTKQVEYGAYEVRCFAEMLMKGSFVILELVFKDGHDYMSPSWRALAAQRQAFVTERGIQHYMGLIKNNFRMIETDKHKDCPKERKLFYQIYHKLDSLEYFLRGVAPPVRCTGPVRDFILRVRTAPLQGDLHRDKLYRDAQARHHQLRDQLANRRNRLPENAAFHIIVDWIMAVRGLDTT